MSSFLYCGFGLDKSNNLFELRLPFICFDQKINTFSAFPSAVPLLIICPHWAGIVWSQNHKLSEINEVNLPICLGCKIIYVLAKNLISCCIFCSNGITLITYLICFEHLVIRALHDILSNVLLEGDRFHVGAAEKLSLYLLFFVWERFSFLDFLAGHLSAPPPPLCIGRLTPGHPYTISPVLCPATPILYRPARPTLLSQQTIC